MKFRHPRFWIAFFSTAAVLYIVLERAGKESPGPVATVHARAEDVDGGANCAACHGGWFESMGDACLECHDAIGGQIDEGEGLHGVIDPKTAMGCATCHSEHHGPDFAMVNRQSFAGAGVRDPEAFDHAIVGYPMAGRHLELSCEACHENARVAVLPEGAVRFLGLDRDCATCHEDPHEGYVLSCASCHSQEAWDVYASEGHDAHLPLIGGHGDLSCAECHEGPHALDALGKGAKPVQRACTDCHESPHTDAFLAGEPGCASCHAADHETFRDERLTLSAEQHARSGFPLVAPHADVACAACHDPARASFPARYPGRAPNDCARCHEDVHRGQFEKTGCLECHDPLAWEPHLFTVAMHERAKLPLTGSHLETDCAECHEDPRPGAARVFRGLSSECESCHLDAHEGAFDRFRNEFAKVRHGACARCHRTTTFSETPEGGFDHARWTGFPLSGAHGQARCEACHPLALQPDRFGRVFGRVREHFGVVAGCATCHDDPHEGWFDKRGAPRVVSGLSDCARCHVETSFRAFPKGFDHGKWTGFPLTGSHQGVACSECHAPLRTPDASGRTWAPAAGARCSACHEDPHERQFEVRGVTNCRRCHRAAGGFDDLAFNHELDSRFRLGEAHRAVACDACHKPVRKGDITFVRYRPMGRECADCHGAQDDPLRKAKGAAR